MSKVTAEIHIDSKGFTWQFYNDDHHLLVEWSMKRNKQGGFTGTQEGDITDALTKAEKEYNIDLRPLIGQFAYEDFLTNPGDVCDGLRALETT